MNNSHQTLNLNRIISLPVGFINQNEITTFTHRPGLDPDASGVFEK